MSAIATVLVQMGHTVSGSDLRESRALERLGLLDVTTHVGHDGANLPHELDAVVISTAIPPHNPEVEAAVARGVPVFRRAEALRAIVATRKTIAVAGSHGKTTTSSMLALIMRAAGWHPELHHRRRPERGRHQCCVRFGRVAGGRSRRERRDVPRAGTARRRGHEHPARPPRPLRRFPGPGAIVRHVRRRRPRCAGAVCGRRGRGRAGRRTTRRCRHLRVRSGCRLPDECLRRWALRYSVRALGSGRRAGVGRAPSRRTPQRGQRRGCGRGRPGAGHPVRLGDTRASAVSAASLAGSNSVASSTASPTSTTTRTCRATSTR